MGGFGSGRSGGRPTTESGLTLNLSKLRRDGLFQPGSFQSGSLVWTNTTTGEKIGSIGYEAHLDQESGRVRLKYVTTRWNGERRESDYWIQLETIGINPKEYDADRLLRIVLIKSVIKSNAGGEDDFPPCS